MQGSAVVPAFKHAAGTNTGNTLHHIVSIVELFSSVFAQIQQ